MAHGTGSSKGQGRSRGDPRVSDSDTEQDKQDKLKLRNLAVQAAIMAKASTFTKKTGEACTWWARAAACILAEMAAQEGLQMPRDAARFCSRWHGRFQERNGVHDAQRTGRKLRIPSAVVDAAVEIVVQVAPRSQRDLNTHPAIQHILDIYKVSAKTLWRQVRAKQPDLGKTVLIEYKMPLTAEVKVERVEAVKRWLRKVVIVPSTEGPSGSAGPISPDTSADPIIPKTISDLHTDGWMRRVIWVDAKKFYINPKSHKVLGLAGTHSVVKHDLRLRQSWVIHYYSAVNYKYGGYYIQIVSGTKGKGYKPGKIYEVRGYAGV